MVKGTCSITGATGFLGNHLAQKMKDSGWKVKRIQRKNAQEKKDGCDIVYFSMGEKLDPSSLAHVDLLIHCAYDFSCTNWDEINEVNVKGTKFIFEAAKAAEVSRIVFISSMHAFEGCQTLYGKAKLACEKEAFDHGAIVIRPGTIHGEKDGKLFGGRGGNTFPLFEKLFNIIPVLPIPHSKRPTVYTSYLEDLCDLIEEAVSRNKVLDNPICAVYKKPYTLKEFLLMIKNRCSKRKVLLVPVPWRILWFFLFLLEKTKVNLSFGSESLLIFFDQNPNPDFSTLEQFTKTIRSFESKI